MIFIESGLVVGFLLPGDSILFAAGLLAAEPGSSLSLPLLAVGSFACAATGNVVGYWTGSRFGRPWLLGRAGYARRHVERAERFYLRFGWLAVVAARFIPWARTFTPVAAGVARMSRPTFVSATLVGAAVWGAGLVLLGYLAHDVPWLARLAYLAAAVAIAASVVVPVAGWAAGRFRRRRRERPPQTPSSASP
ncbi:MAG TPA: DedA family protein [Kineosporiaceae bacterium]|nr:DedA family protein [Kineosporiaceae bacterium]